MTKYKITVDESLEKKFSKLPKQDLLKIREKIRSLAENPRPVGCKKLTGSNLYRVRQGDYRVIYEIKDHILTVLVLETNHRKNVYKSINP